MSAGISWARNPPARNSARLNPAPIVDHDAARALEAYKAVQGGGEPAGPGLDDAAICARLDKPLALR